MSRLLELLEAERNRNFSDFSKALDYFDSRQLHFLPRFRSSDIVEERPFMFALDLFHYAAKQYGIEDYPNAGYVPHPLSPFIAHISLALENAVDGYEEDFGDRFLAMEHEDREITIRKFLAHVAVMLSHSMSNCCDRHQLLEVVIYVARLCVEYYMNGMPEAMNVGVSKVATALLHYGTLAMDGMWLDFCASARYTAYSYLLKYFEQDLDFHIPSTQAFFEGGQTLC